MDEPLSNLDAKLRVQMRAELVEAPPAARRDDDLRHPRPDRGDDARRSACGARQRRRPAGRHAQELYGRPANKFVASFIGSPAMNFVPARLVRGAVELGPVSARASRERVRKRLVREPESDVVLGLRPSTSSIPGSPRPGRLPAIACR